MSDKKKKKDKNTKKGISTDDPNKLSKEEDAIARFVRFNCPTNKTLFEGNEVHYFSGKKAVDVLVDSKKYGAKAKVPKFVEPADAEDFLQMLLNKGLFFRAKKMVLKKKDKCQELKSSSKSRDVSKSPKVGKKEKKEKIEEEKAETEAEGKDRDEKVGEQEEDKKKKKKIKLMFNDVQTFQVDNTTDVFVWIFDPTPFWKKCVGVLMVLGTIGGCLFPLWPEWLRLGVYYLSVTGIALFGLLLGVALARTILFALIWLFTVGRHHLWVLPNLMEDCGFFESFQPFYTYEHVPGGFFAKNEGKKKKKDSDAKKSSSKEEGDEKEPLVQPEEDEEKTADGIEVEPDEPVENDGPDDEEVHEDEENDEQKVGEGEEEEEGEVQSDSNSNSWEQLSENSQRSTEAGASNEARKND